MHVLTISTDKKILDTNSAVAARMVAQANVPAAAWDSSVLIVCTTGTHAPVQLAHNVMAYPTNSASKLAYGLDVLRLGMQHGRAADVISAQDPFEVGLVGTLLGWSLRRPVQLQVHTDFLSPTFVGHSTLNRVRVWIAGAILPKAKRVRVVSQRIQQSLNRVYKHLPPIDVLPVFVDIEHITATQLSDALRERFGRFVTKVLVVARFESEKNVGLAIDNRQHLMHV
jgi:glycosyltransferase involved in cell wall biosynthesis